MLINYMREILSQCMCISNYYDIHFKYFTILFVSYTLIKQTLLKSMRDILTKKVYSSLHSNYALMPKTETRSDSSSRIIERILGSSLDL